MLKRYFVGLQCVFVTLTFVQTLRGVDWKPIEPSLLTLKTSRVEKDADAEAIFWEVRVSDAWDGYDVSTVLNHYIRIKIFTDQGTEKLKQIDLEYLGKRRIDDIVGRTIKTDGSIVELKKEDIFERSLVRGRGVRLKAKSFAMPAVQSGVIIEYRWKESRLGELANYLRLPFQRDIPIQTVKYTIKPLTHPDFPFLMSHIVFNGKTTPMVEEPDHFFSTSMTNVPAFWEEPYMPPEDTTRPWMLVYYVPDKKLTPEKFWMDYGKEVFNAHKSAMKPDGNLKKIALENVGTAQTPEEKLKHLFDFCRARIKNVNDDASGISAVDVEKFRPNKNATDTLKSGMGTGLDINLLFAALANAAGFEARLTRLGDRSRGFFDPSVAVSHFLRSANIAVRIGSDWRFFDPAGKFVAFDMLRWAEEGQDALISDPKEPVFVKTPISPPQKSLRKRNAEFNLDANGTLEGDVKIEYTGHFAADERELYDELTPAEREQTVSDSLKLRISPVEVEKITIENLSDSSRPLAVSYHVRIPGYASRTGKRLFLPLSYFELGRSPLFTASTRKHPIYFHFHWTEEDNIVIRLPKGFELDNADAPGPIKLADLAKYDVKLIYVAGESKLKYQRSFQMGKDKVVLISPALYAPVKQMFDAVHDRDSHNITLKSLGLSTLSESE